MIFVWFLDKFWFQSKRLKASGASQKGRCAKKKEKREAQMLGMVSFDNKGCLIQILQVKRKTEVHIIYECMIGWLAGSSKQAQ